MTDLFDAMAFVGEELERRTTREDIAAGVAATVRIQAIAQADANANADWKVEAERVVRHLADAGQPFTADDVWGILQGEGVSTHEPSALGGIVQRLARDGIISRTGRQVPTRLERRHRDLTEWVGAEHLGTVQRQAMWARYDDDLAALAKLTKQSVYVNVHPGGPCVVHWGTVNRTEARTLAAAAAKALREAKG